MLLSRLPASHDIGYDEWQQKGEGAVEQSRQQKHSRHWE